MTASCCICSDVFNEEHSICATSCGHVFHADCLRLWIDRINTCPICRSQVDVRSTLKLYFDFSTTSDRSTTLFRNSNLENEVINLKTRISAKDIALDKCKKEIEKIKALVRQAEKKESDLQKSLYKSKFEVLQLRLKAEESAELESKFLQLQEVNHSMQNEIQMLYHLQSIVHGTQEEADSIIRKCGNGSGSSMQIATYCSVLKRELQREIYLKNELLGVNSKLKLENCRFAAKVKFYENPIGISDQIDSSPHEKSMKEPSKYKEFACNSRSAEFNNSPVPNAVASSAGNKSNNQNNTDISPLSVPFNKSKFNMCIAASSSTSQNAETATEMEKYVSASCSTIKKRSDDGSIIRSGYYEHGNFISTPSGIKRIRSIKNEDY